MRAPRRALTTLFLIAFADLVGFGIVIPLLPLYAEHYHPAPWVFGLLMAAYSAMQFFSSPILGRLSDRVGRRPVLLVSLTGSVVGFVMFALADSLIWLFASRLLAGIAGGNIATAQAVIADTTKPEDRARGMGLIGAAFGLGFIAGPALAGVLAPISPAAPGWGAATCSAVAFAMTLLYLPETRPVGPPARMTPAYGVARIAFAWRHPELAPLMLIGFAVVTGFAAFEVTFAQYLHERLALPHSGVSFLFVYIGVLAAIVQGVLVGRATRWLGERRLVIGGLAVGAVGLLLLASAHRLGVVLAVLPALSLGIGMVMPSLSALVSRGVSADQQGLALGAFQGIASLARVAGPFTAEVALGSWGVAAPQVGAAVLAAAAAGGAAAVLRRAGTHPEGTSLGHT
ncbi:MAG TPA: MFS transporter [Thermoanaerobaculaceae bacterium]|nr:MFS transporter [Thermoanaerobaculaceae bacterium]